MDSGAYRELVKIQKYVEGMDEIGNPSDRWKDYKRTYAYVNGLSGVEYWEAANAHQENTVEFVFRWKPFFDEMDTKRYRILFRGKTYDINLIDNIQYRNRMIKIKAVTKNSEGG